MKGPGLNLERFWQRLTGGAVLGRSAEIMPTVQPVVIAADWTRLAGRLNLAEGFAGIQQNVALGSFATFFLAPNSPGGLLVRWFNIWNPIGAGASVSLHYRLGIHPKLAGVGGGTSSIYSINPNRPCVAVSGVVTSAAGHIPTFQTGDLSRCMGGDALGTTRVAQSPLPTDVWVPPGSAFYIESGVASQGISGSVYFVELDAHVAG